MARLKKKQTKSTNNDNSTNSSLTLEEKFFQLTHIASRIDENMSKFSDNSLISGKSVASTFSSPISESIYQNIGEINSLYVAIESNVILNRANHATILDKYCTLTRF